MHDICGPISHCHIVQYGPMGPYRYLKSYYPWITRVFPVQGQYSFKIVANGDTSHANSSKGHNTRLK